MKITINFTDQNLPPITHEEIEGQAISDQYEDEAYVVFVETKNQIPLMITKYSYFYLNLLSVTKSYAK